jgi:hypothetical protein
MTISEINDRFNAGDLKGLQSFFNRGYRGQVASKQNYEETLEDLFYWIDLVHYRYDPYLKKDVQTVAGMRFQRAQKKAILLDAIITLQYAELNQELQQLLRA